MATGAAAQTTVTNNNDGTNGTVPVYSGSATLNGTSPISVSGGNVGIGTPTPAEALEVDGNVKATRFRSTRYLNLTDANTEEIQFGNVADGPISFLTNNADRLFIESNGNVGIGTTSPATKLHVATASGNTPLQMTVGSETWQVGQNVGAGSSDNTFGFYSSTFGPSHSYAPVMTMTNGGNVGVGTTSPQYPLSVNGTIQAKEVLVNTGWADYVFQPDYRVRTLAEVSAFIKANHHLPGIPSEAEVEEKGVSLGEMQARLLAKIEELTLQLIQLDEKNRELEKRVAQIHSTRAAKSGRSGGK